MMFLSRILICVIFFFLFVRDAWAEAMTLEQTLQAVYDANPSITASRYGQKATEELYPQALSGWYPVVTSEAGIYATDINNSDSIGGVGDGATTKNASISIDQPLYRGGRTTSSTKSAKSRIGAGKSRVVQTEQNILLASVERYMNVMRDRIVLSLQQRNESLLREEVESIHARFNAGDVTQTDVKQTEAQYARALSDTVRAESLLKESEARFEDVTGFWPSPDMLMPTVVFRFPATVEEMDALADRQNPSVGIVRLEREAALSDVDVVASDLYPQVSAYGSYIKEFDPQPGLISDSSTGTVGVRARLLLYDGDNTRSRRREAKSRAMQREQDIKSAEREVKGDLVARWQRLRALESQIIAQQSEIEAQRIAREGVHQEARLGERTVLDVLDADQALLDAEISMAQLQRDRVVTGYQLAATLGYLQPDYLGLRPAPALPGDQEKGPEGPEAR